MAGASSRVPEDDAPPTHEDHSSLPLERDRLSLGMLLLALAGNAALFLYIRVQFAALPAVVPLHFDASGYPDRLAEKSGLFTLPTIGLLIVGTNLLLGLLLRRRFELASRFLWGGAVVAQILLAVAVYNIIH